MVMDLKDYPWASYATHGLGVANPLLRELPVWSALAATEPDRQEYWRRLVHEPLSAHELTALRRSVTSGRPFGSATWAECMGARLGVALTAKRRGRPPKYRPAEGDSKTV